MDVIDNIYLLENKKMPWGDWGSILWEGITSRDPVTGAILIARTGPFSPSLYMSSNDFVFTSEAKSLYEKSLLSGIEFSHEIAKSKIVRINWHDWNHKQHITNYLDIDGEPEELILNMESDEALMDNMPEYWLADIKANIHLFIDKSLKSNNPSDYIFIDGELERSDFFIGVERTGVYITQNAKDWMDYNFPEHFAYFKISRK
ncbi:hypothetical protein S483_004707 [Salmonella enterica subsp. salamae]|nr:hypothetical protein [Salmonella enterica subsp. salamae]